ncbi:hypothetical protein JCM10207_000479 [Rhodosporidiobolus poonsookiae]
MGAATQRRIMPQLRALAKQRRLHIILFFLALAVQPFLLLRCRQSSSSYPVHTGPSALFLPSANPKPVHHLPHSLNFDNHPVSRYRPATNQFLPSPQLLTREKPTIALITATKDAQPAFFRETAASVFGQSVQNFRWVIVDDGTTLPGALEVLQELTRDRRVTLLRNDQPRGLAASRNRALEAVLAMKDVPPYMAALDDHDMYELTALEKVVSMLESNSEWSLGGFQVVKHGHKQHLTVSGLHNGAASLAKSNLIPDAAVLATQALRNSSCRYDETVFAEGGENHRFWLCLAKAGHWGGTIAEPLFWQRSKAHSRRSLTNSTAAALTAEESSAALAAGALHDIAARPAQQLETVRWRLPSVSNALVAPADGKTLMIVLPTFADDHTTRSALQQLQLFAEQGYRVTVVATRNRANGLALRPEVYKYTHDVHVLPTYVRPSDAPAYLKNLITSRGIKEVVFSSSKLIYEMLPVLREQLPTVKFVDFLPTEHSNTFATFSAISQRFLARTVAPSYAALSHLSSLAASSSLSVGVVRPGVDTQALVPVSPRTQAAAKKELLALSPKTSVILVSSPLFTIHRPHLVPEVAASLLQSGHRDFLIVLLGNVPPAGDLSASDIVARAAELNVTDYVRIYDTRVEHPESYLAASDLYLRLSASDEESLMLAEAMAMGIPVVSASTRGAAEQLGSLRTDGKRGGLLVDVPASAPDDAVAVGFASKVSTLLLDEKLARMYATQSRQIATETLDWRKTQAKWFDELDKARNAPVSRFESGRGELSVNPAVHYALQTVLVENHDETDFYVSQQRLKAPPRSGIGKELQDRCGETDADITEWINGVVAAEGCDPNQTLDVETLQRSAKFQCRAWCIFDLTTPELAGWSFDGKCFWKMDANTHCSDWFSSRPKVNLAKSA